MKLWQHEDTGNITATETQPLSRYFEIPTIHEDDLPNNISKELYSWWFDNSFIDGVRIGPKI